MKRSPTVERLLKNMDNIYLLGKQRAFELGNPFYAKYKGDGEFYRKQLPTGEEFLVRVKIVVDENGMPIKIEDTVIKQLIP
jgi:hypothetical protein